MERTKEDLIRSKIALKVAIDALRHELWIVEKQLEEKKSEPALTENFFWDALVPIIEQYEHGVTSADLRRALKTIGRPVNSNALSTFLSRNKTKNRLLLDENTVPPKWHLAKGLIRPKREEN